MTSLEGLGFLSQAEGVIGDLALIGKLMGGIDGLFRAAIT